MKMKIVSAVIIFAAIIFFFYKKLSPPFLASYRYSSISPDKKYRVDVYSEPMFGAMPGGGGAGSHNSAIILRNSWGWEIGSNAECPIFMDDVDIEWDSDKYVTIALARSIDLNTGECEQ